MNLPDLQVKNTCISIVNVEFTFSNSKIQTVLYSKFDVTETEVLSPISDRGVRKTQHKLIIKLINIQEIKYNNNFLIQYKIVNSQEYRYCIMICCRAILTPLILFYRLSASFRGIVILLSPFFSFAAIFQFPIRSRLNASFQSLYFDCNQCFLAIMLFFICSFLGFVIIPILHRDQLSENL